MLKYTINMVVLLMQGKPPCDHEETNMTVDISIRFGAPWALPGHMAGRTRADYAISPVWTVRCRIGIGAMVLIGVGLLALGAAAVMQAQDLLHVR